MNHLQQTQAELFDCGQELIRQLNSLNYQVFEYQYEWYFRQEYFLHFEVLAQVLAQLSVASVQVLAQVLAQLSVASVQVLAQVLVLVQVLIQALVLAQE
ncbi:hypothetical protein GMMP1_540096 [Candidatus Magnetomoraceae bacterium gMMP-1]